MTGAIKRLCKDDAERLDYFADYTEELTELGDTIEDSVWIVPSDSAVGAETVTLKDEIEVDYDAEDPSPAYSDDDTPAVDISGTMKTFIFLDGGTLGNTYRIMNRVTTTTGRIYSRVFDLYIERRSE